MPRIELSPHAVDDLHTLIRTHSLPADTKGRVRRVLEPLASFPYLGKELGGRWSKYRVLLGPWRWMLLAYRVDSAHDRVVVVTIQDARISTAATQDSSQPPQ